MNKYGNLKCEGCGSYALKLHVSADGLDEQSAAGAGSGFVWEVSLDCGECGRVFPICRTREFNHVSDIADKEDKP
ncbi:MAG: hypothetical protein NC299_12910 [Lachnospiraceae bacterium]|nr:hypothetical protein [Ruminococcus sp.]MCM1276238.1 hypothetical protein [Lachnospiraceae bacterium]